MMTIDVIIRQGHSLVVPRVQRLDSALVQDFRRAMEKAVAAETDTLILDLDAVNLVDSSILGVVVGVFRNLPDGQRLVLCSLRENVACLLHLTHLDRILTVYPTVEEAMAALAH